MDREVRSATLGVLAVVFLILLACAPIPRRPGTREAEMTATGRRLLGQAKTATARARELGQGGDVVLATPTARNLALATPTAIGQAAGWRERVPSGQELLPGQPLPQGMNEWDLWLQPGASSPGDNQVFLAQDNKYGSVMAMVRTCDCSDGGAAGVVLVPELNVSRWGHLYVWLMGKIEDERGGNIANTDPKWFPEGAVQVRLRYSAAGGERAEWYHGFHISDVSGPDRQHFRQVKAGQWFSYLSEDLAGLSPRPVTINEVRIYGFGWEFRSAVAQASLVGSYGPAG
jgi:hypothetical protein